MDLSPWLARQDVPGQAVGGEDGRRLRLRGRCGGDAAGRGALPAVEGHQADLARRPAAERRHGAAGTSGRKLLEC